MRFWGDFPTQFSRHSDISKVSNSNVVHVSQFIPVDHFEVTFVTAKAPNNRPIGSIDLCDGAEMEPVDDIIPLVILLYAVNVTDAGQSHWRQDFIFDVLTDSRAAESSDKSRFLGYDLMNATQNLSSSRTCPPIERWTPQQFHPGQAVKLRSVLCDRCEGRRCHCLRAQTHGDPTL